MSDHEPFLNQDAAVDDRVDYEYVRAEAILDDVQTRAARRARVLAAVALRPDDAIRSPTRPRAAWGRGGWLIAASVAGLSILATLQIRSPASGPQSTGSKLAPPSSAEPAPQISEAPAPAILTPDTSQASSPARRASGHSIGAAPDLASEQAARPPLPLSPAEHRLDEPSSFASDRAAAPAASAGFGQLDVAQKLRTAREENAVQLRDAAEAGQTDEMAALLAKGAPVDLPDAKGDTALMKSVQADHPAAASLLRRHGASLNLRNLAGESARDLAATIGDPKLDRALSEKP